MNVRGPEEPEAVGDRAPATAHRLPISGFHAAPNDGTLHAVVLRLSSRGVGRGRTARQSGRTSGLRIGLVEIEVARRLLLEPETVVLGRLLEELGRVLERVFAVARLGLVLVRAPRGSAPPRARAGERPRSGTPRCRARPAEGRARPRRAGGSAISSAGSSTVSSTGCVGNLLARLADSASAATAVASSSASAGRGKSRRAGPSASASFCAISSSVAPCRRFRSRCSRIASSRSPIGAVG